MHKLFFSLPFAFPLRKDGFVFITREYPTILNDFQCNMFYFIRWFMFIIEMTYIKWLKEFLVCWILLPIAPISKVFWYTKKENRAKGRQKERKKDKTNLNLKSKVLRKSFYGDNWEMDYICFCFFSYFVTFVTTLVWLMDSKELVDSISVGTARLSNVISILLFLVFWSAYLKEYYNILNPYNVLMYYRSLSLSLFNNIFFTSWIFTSYCLYICQNKSKCVRKDKWGKRSKNTKTYGRIKNNQLFLNSANPISPFRSF